MKTSDSNEDIKGSSSRPPKSEVRRYSGSKEAISSKYAAMKEQSKPTVNTEKANVPPAKVSLLNAGTSEPSNSVKGPTGFAARWASMKAGLQTFKTNLEAKGFPPLRQVGEFVPLRQSQDTPHHLPRLSSSESLDEIFQKLKRPAAEHNNHSDDEDEDIMNSK